MLKLYDGKAYDFEKEPSDTIQNAYDAKVEFDKGYMLTFKVIVDDKGLHKKIREEMIVVCKGGYKNKENAFRIKERLEFGTYVEFKCPHLFYDLDHKRTKVPSGLFTANDIISFIQNNTEDIDDFKFKNDYIFGDAKLEFGNYKEIRDKKPGEKVEPKVEYYNTLELMNKIFNEYDCEFMFDFWTINVYNKLGQDKESLIYEYKNIEDWEGIHSMEGKATRVIAQSDFERTTTYKTKYPNQKLYIHFAYGNDNKGKDFTNTNYQSRKYIGYYVDTKYLNSPNAKDYKWVSMKIPRKTKKKPAFKGNRKVKGITSFMVGTDYRDGIPIKLDKKTFYLHTAFANYLDGKDININDGTGAKYVGFMIDDKKGNTRVKEWFTFNHLTEKGGLLINDRRTLKEKVHLETVVDSPLVNDYAQIYHDTYINNEARTVDELSQNVLDLFDEGWDKPRRTIKCKVKLTNNDRHRLTTLGDYLYYGDNDPCDIYDTVILRYITHNVDERIKCIGFEYDPINENLEMLKFGSKEKNDTISSSVTSGVKANIEQKQTEFDRRWQEINDYYDEELRKGREEFNHIWLSEKIDFINGFNEYGEYVEDIQAELDRIDAERKQKTEELNKRLAENDELLKTTKESLMANTNQAINVATEELNRIDKEIVTINNNVVDLNKTKADIKEVYTKKDVDFKVDELNNSITSEVTKTVYSKVNSSINSHEYINKLKGVDGSNFTWNLIKKSLGNIETGGWQNSKVNVVDDNYVFSDSKLNKGKRITGTDGKSVLKTYVDYGKNIDAKDVVKNSVYTISVYIKNLSETNTLILKLKGFNWFRYDLKPGEERFIVKTGKFDGTQFKLEFSSVNADESQDFVYTNLKLEKGENNNPVWTPHISDIKGKDGRDGIAGKDGISSFTHIAYSNSADGSKDFSTNNSNREYIGICVDNNKTDSEDYKSYKWSKIKGLDGKDGIAGKNGVGIKSTNISYGLSSSETKEPTSWTKAVPNLIKGKYLWTKTVWSYTDNTSETGYTKTYIAKDGNTGKDGIPGKDGVGIKSTTITYAKSKSGTSAPTSGWTSSIPNTSPGDFLWTKTVWNYTDNTSETGYSVSKIGKDGSQGIPGKAGADGKTPYLHIAYSNSQDGSKDFSVNDSKRDYIGTYTDFSKADSADYKKYSWSKIKGEFEGEIGARNLIRNSDKITGWIKYDGGNHTVNDVFMEEFNIQGQRIKSDAGDATELLKSHVGLDVDDLVVGKTYTFSVYVKNNRDVPAQLRINGFNWNFTYELNANECKRFVVTGKRVNMEGYWKNRIQFQLRSANKGQFVDMTVARPQLEEGDVATSWSKNPSDFVNELGLARDEFKSFKEETEKHFLQTVSLDKYNQFNQLYQKEQSELKQTVNEINSKITKTQGDLKQYSNLSQKVNSMSSNVAQIEPLKLSHAKLEQKVNSFSSNLVEISNNTKKISTLTQTVNGLSSTVSSLSNGLDSKIGSIIEQKKSSIVLGIGNITGLQKNLDSLQSSITVNKKSITAKADSVDLVGKVSFSDLNYENKGRDSYTFIDGGRIITDTITSLQIQAEAIMSSHLYVSKAMISKLNTDHLLANEIKSDSIFTNYLNALDIDANRIKTGIISAKNGVSKINLNDGTFSFYNGSLSIDETYFDEKSSTYRARVHTQSTFRVSYAGRPIVELNSGGVVLFHGGAVQSSSPSGQMRINKYGCIEVLSSGNGDTLVKCVDIGDGGDGYKMTVYGSLYVQRNLRVGSSIRYGGNIQQGTSF